MAEGLDLYEFPATHIGRKSYVSVRGHSRSVPKFKTYRGTDGRNHLRPEYGGDWSGLGNSAPTFVPDKAGYVSPIDGLYYEGRKAHREHCARHSVLEAGDMKIGEYAGRDRAPLTDLKHDIRRTISELG